MCIIIRSRFTVIHYGNMSPACSSYEKASNNRVLDSTDLHYCTYQMLIVLFTIL